jgi:hypothetical protein
MLISWPIIGSHLTKLCHSVNKTVPRITTPMVGFVPVSGNSVLINAGEVLRKLIHFYLEEGGIFVSWSGIRVSAGAVASYFLPLQWGRPTKFRDITYFVLQHTVLSVLHRWPYSRIIYGKLLKL